MKADFKTKLLQHLIAKKNNEGFTLIELLVVIIIIGILAAIALPSFLNQAAKARQSEAKTYVGTMNRTQQAYYTEEAAFAADLATLKAGVPSQTESYDYQTVGAADNAVSTATARAAELKGYEGTVQINATTGNSDAKLCSTETAGIGQGPGAAFDCEGADF